MSDLTYFFFCRFNFSVYQGKFSLKQKLCAKKFLVRKLRTNQDLGERKADLRNTTPVSLFISEKNKKPRKVSLNEFHSDVGDVSESDYLLLRFLFNENRNKSNCGGFMHFQQRALKLSSLITELKEVWWKVGNRLQTFVCSFSDKGNMITLAPRNRVLWTKNTAKEKHTSALMQLFISICQNVVNNLV